jgi:predicted nucleic acid binding AN1-type Zn finger protein
VLLLLLFILLEKVERKIASIFLPKRKNNNTKVWPTRVVTSSFVTCPLKRKETIKAKSEPALTSVPSTGWMNASYYSVVDELHWS